MQNYENYVYKTPKKANRHGFKKLVVFLGIFSVLIIYLTYYVNPKILETSSAQIKSLAISQINKGVKMVSLTPHLYDNLIKISYNNSGDITLISSNSYAINELSTSIIEITQKYLNEMGEQGILIPLGNFSGLAFLSNLGPNIKIRMTPIGLAQTKLSSSFTSKGINQTLHELFLNITCKIKVILPIRTLNLEVNSEVIIAESVIVGKIPSTYFNTDKIFSLY